MNECASLTTCCSFDVFHWKKRPCRKKNVSKFTTRLSRRFNRNSFKVFINLPWHLSVQTVRPAPIHQTVAMKLHKARYHSRMTVKRRAAAEASSGPTKVSQWAGGCQRLVTARRFESMKNTLSGGCTQDEWWGKKERICVGVCVWTLIHCSLLHQPLSVLQTIGLVPGSGWVSPPEVTAISFSLTSCDTQRSQSGPNWMVTVEAAV